MRTAELFRLETIAIRLARFVAPRDKNYDASWKRREGVGAFFTIMRPIDRFEAIAKAALAQLRTSTIADVALSDNPNGPAKAVAALQSHKLNSYDIFRIWQVEDDTGILYKDGTLSACVQDIACYMLLLIEEMEARKQVIYPRDAGEQIPVDTSGKPVGHSIQQSSKSERIAPPSLDMGIQTVEQLLSEQIQNMSPEQILYWHDRKLAIINGLQEQVQNQERVIAKQRQQIEDLKNKYAPAPSAQPHPLLPGNTCPKCKATLSSPKSDTYRCLNCGYVLIQPAND